MAVLRFIFMQAKGLCFIMVVALPFFETFTAKSIVGRISNLSWLAPPACLESSIMEPKTNAGHVNEEQEKKFETFPKKVSNLPNTLGEC